MMRYRLVLSFLIAGGLACFAAAVRAEEISAGSIFVVDGDTISVDGKRWRLMGFDTPETYYAKCDSELVRGKAATEHLATLIGAAKRIDLEPSGRNDRYHRGLGVLKLDGVDVAVIMIMAGHARPYHGKRREGWCD
jgi:endonuclease YncB( thermonuclease family)